MNHGEIVRFPWGARPLEEIEAEVRSIEKDIVRMLGDATDGSSGESGR